MHRYQLATLSLALLAALAAPVAGQIIPIRTAPLVRADGFDVLPSRHLGMGGVSIAFRDTLGDPSVNPATAGRMTGARAFGAPVAYGVTGNGGGGGALPVGVIGRAGGWFGAGAFAAQTVQPGELGGFGGFGPTFIEEEEAPSRGSTYGFALLGRSWADRGLSVAGSVLAGRRGAVDGIGLVYGESDRVASSGTVAAFRLGVVGEWSGGRSIEAVAVRSSTRMTHDVTYTDFFWDPETQQPTPRPREERYADEADVWGLHVVHSRPLAPGWRVGWLATANRVANPSIPRYDLPRNGILNISSGEGEAYAYDFGVGFARDGGPVRLGLDLLYEPIWTRLRGEDRTGAALENRIRFRNAVVRTGAGRTWQLKTPGSAIEAQVGVLTRLVGYQLTQLDHGRAEVRRHEDGWVEWTPTWGTVFRLGDVEVRYHGSIAYGTSRPGGAAPEPQPCFCVALEILPGPAPADRMAHGPVRVVTQQVLISVPVGKVRGEGGES